MKKITIKKGERDKKKKKTITITLSHEKSSCISELTYLFLGQED